MAVLLLSLVSILAAAEPTPDGPGFDPADPTPAAPGGGEVAARLSWNVVAYSPAAPEQAAYGPDHLAAGPDGAWAVWDPVALQLVGSGGSFTLDGATDLAFTDDGDLLVLDTRRRSLERYTPAGQRLAATTFPGLVPTAVTLEVDGGVAWGVDGLGNAHPIAALAHGLDPSNAPALRRPTHHVERAGPALRVDGVEVHREPGLVAGRVLGDWLVVEVRDGRTVTRSALSLDGSTRVSLPGEGAAYRPSDALTVAPDGRLWWLDPTADALILRTVAP